MPNVRAWKPPPPPPPPRDAAHYDKVRKSMGQPNALRDALLRRNAPLAEAHVISLLQRDKAATAWAALQRAAYDMHGATAPDVPQTVQEGRAAARQATMAALLGMMFYLIEVVCTPTPSYAVFLASAACKRYAACKRLVAARKHGDESPSDTVMRFGLCALRGNSELTAAGCTHAARVVVVAAALELALFARETTVAAEAATHLLQWFNGGGCYSAAERYGDGSATAASMTAPKNRPATPEAMFASLMGADAITSSHKEVRAAQVIAQCLQRTMKSAPARRDPISLDMEAVQQRIRAAERTLSSVDDLLSRDYGTAATPLLEVVATGAALCKTLWPDAATLFDWDGKTVCTFLSTVDNYGLHMTEDVPLDALPNPVVDEVSDDEEDDENEKTEQQPRSLPPEEKEEKKKKKQQKKRRRAKRDESESESEEEEEDEEDDTADEEACTTDEEEKPRRRHRRRDTAKAKHSKRSGRGSHDAHQRRQKRAAPQRSEGEEEAADGEEIGDGNVSVDEDNNYAAYEDAFTNAHWPLPWPMTRHFVTEDATKSGRPQCLVHGPLNPNDAPDEQTICAAAAWLRFDERLRSVDPLYPMAVREKDLRKVLVADADDAAAATTCDEYYFVMPSPFPPLAKADAAMPNWSELQWGPLQPRDVLAQRRPAYRAGVLCALALRCAVGAKSPEPSRLLVSSAGSQSNGEGVLFDAQRGHDLAHAGSEGDAASVLLYLDARSSAADEWNAALEEALCTDTVWDLVLQRLDVWLGALQQDSFARELELLLATPLQRIAERLARFKERGYWFTRMAAVEV